MRQGIGVNYAGGTKYARLARKIYARSPTEGMPMNWLILAIAIVAEVIATSALKASEGFTRLMPSVLVVVGYAISFYCLSLTLKVIPVGVTYAIWSGVGVVLVSLAAWYLYGQALDLASLIGISLIVSGVIILNLFGKVSVH
jgi:small multidrug resistance pump